MQTQTQGLAKELRENLDHALRTIAQRDPSAPDWAIFVWNHLELLCGSSILEGGRKRLREHAEKWKHWSPLGPEHLAKALVDPKKDRAELQALLSDILKVLE